MAKNSLAQALPIVNENGLKFIENNGQILFSSEEIGRQLGYAKPAKSINILFNRNQRELKSYAVGIKVMATDGKSYEVRHFTEEGVYIISMLANTPRARDFRSMLAKLLREIRERRVALARESGYLQGLGEGRAATKPEFLAARTEAAARVWRFGPVKKRRLRSAVRYRNMGLGIAAIAKLLDVNNREISELLKAAEDLGFLSTDKPARPVQGNLLTLNAGEVEA